MIVPFVALYLWYRTRFYVTVLLYILIGLIWVCLVLREKVHGKSKILFCAGFYCMFVSYITVFGRAPNYVLEVQLVPFETYYRIMSYWDIDLIYDNINNLLLFIPIGFFMTCLKSLPLKKLIIIAIVTSFSIELMQLLLHVGYFQVDDIINDTIGVFIGYQLCKKYMHYD